MMLRQLKSKWIVLLVLGCVVMISAADIARRQHNNQKVEWKRNIFADGAGYYVYLPWFFIYDCNASQLPENIEKTTGYGFKIIENKVKTKYTMGVALMQTPMFLLVHSFAKITGSKADGFSEFYQFVSFFSALIYSLLGLYLLFRFLRFYCSPFASILVIFSIFLGSNFYFYLAEFPAQSHVYSFFLVTLLLHSAHQFFKSPQNKYWVGVAFSAALLVLIRPTNIIMLPIIAFIPSLQKNPSSFRKLLSVRRIVISALIFFAVFMPQFLYWKMISGSYIYYSYNNEGFSNQSNPVLDLFLFSPNNGLFAYTPLWFLLIGSALYMGFRKHYYSIGAIAIFIGIIYLGASWFDWRFGCSFGSRTTIEYLPLFALPFALLIDVLRKKSILIRVLIYSFTVICIVAALLLGHKYEKCFLGQDDWDWKYYGYLMRPWSQQKSWVNPNPKPLSDEYIGNAEINTSEKDSFSKYFKIEAEVEFAPIPSEAEVFIAISSSGSSNDIQHLERLQPNRNRQTTRVMLPPNSGDWQVCKAFVWNKSRSPIGIKNLRLAVE